MRTHRLRNWAIVSAVCAVLSVAYRLTADGQVPIIGLNGIFGTLVSGCNGCGATPWTTGGFTQGSWLAWNNNGGSNGETDFINLFPSGSNGGFAWFSQSTSSLHSIMTLSQGGLLAVAQINAALTGNVTGSISGGNVQGGTGTFGNLIAACNGCGATAWNPGSLTSGTWFSQGLNGGSNLETDIINYHGASPGGFSWFTPSSSSLGSAVMSLSTAGNLTVASVTAALHGNADTATTAGTTSGNAATATALAAAPGSCSTPNMFFSGMAANGTPTCTAPVIGRATTVNSTSGADSATATTVVNLSTTMPDTNYTASCNIVGGFGSPSVSYITKGTSSISVTIKNGTSAGAVASGGSEIDCTISGT